MTVPLLLLQLAVLFVAGVWLTDSIRTSDLPPNAKWAAVLILRLALLLLGWYLTGLPPMGHGAG